MSDIVEQILLSVCLLGANLTPVCSTGGGVVQQEITRKQNNFNWCSTATRVIIWLFWNYLPDKNCLPIGKKNNCLSLFWPNLMKNLYIFWTLNMAFFKLFMAIFYLTTLTYTTFLYSLLFLSLSLFGQVFFFSNN